MCDTGGSTFLSFLGSGLWFSITYIFFIFPILWTMGGYIVYFYFHEYR